MAMSVVYTNFCGMIVSETRGGVERDYVPDTLGSTAALVDSSQTITDRWEYWPYGEVSQRTGVNQTPFTFVGMRGYFKDILAKLTYIRARHLRVDLARWLTVDPLWPNQPQFVYVGARPTSNTDPSGKIPPQVALAILGCVVNAGLSIWDVIRGGGGLMEALCKGAVSCLTGALAGFILGILPPGAIAVGCLVGALASLIGAALAKACEPPPRCIKPNDPPCAAIAAGFSALMGCIGGGTGDDIADVLIGFIIGITGVTCQSALEALRPR